MSGGYFLIAFPKHEGERNRSISSAAVLLRIIKIANAALFKS